ncbi:cytochrome C biogenesis protein [Anaerostipes caccae]|nr:cytochrome C biogenesis protein [Anaerostipes caccae]
MQYLISFLEGIVTFISPCLLPMLPIYISYFAGETTDRPRHKALPNAITFVAGFTLVFILLGAFAGTLGGLLTSHKMIVNIITGLIVIIFGLNFTGALNISFLNRTKRSSMEVKKHTLASSFLFGIVFFHWLDPMCRGIPWLCTDDGVTAGLHGRRHPHAVSLLHGPRHPVHSQRRAH